MESLKDLFLLPLFPRGLQLNLDVNSLSWESKLLYVKPSTFLCLSVQIVTKSNRSLTLDLVYREESSGSIRLRNHGKLTVHAEECINSKTTTEMVLRCSDLEYKDLFSRSVRAANLDSLQWRCEEPWLCVIHFLTYLAGPLFGNIKSRGEWDPNSSLQNGSNEK